MGLALLPLCAHAQATFQTIGELPGGLPVSYATTVSADGSVVSGFSYSDQGQSAFRWTRDRGIEALPRDFGPGVYTGGLVSPNGEFITGRYNGIGSIWSESGGTHLMGDLPGGIEFSVVRDVNDDGTIVGYSSYDLNPFGASINRAVRWTESGGLEALPLPEPDDYNGSSQAFGLLDDGRILGKSESGTWLYSESTGFEMVPGAENMNAVNSDGTFMVGTAINVFQTADVASYWTPDTGFQYLPGPGQFESSGVSGMSDDGSIITGVVGPDEVVWVDQGDPILFTDFAESYGIDMSEWNILGLFGVSADGTTIVGGAKNINWDPNRIEGFVLTIPAPGTIGVLGLALLFTRRRRNA